jgi:hypothetical protein
VYLLVTKRLFGIRGGKRAYDARLREESIMASATTAAEHEAGQREAGQHQAAGDPQPADARPAAD